MANSPILSSSNIEMIKSIETISPTEVAVSDIITLSNTDETEDAVQIIVHSTFHPFDAAVNWSNDDMLFISDFPHQNEDCGRHLKELLDSWNCSAFYSDFMSTY